MLAQSGSMALRRPGIYFQEQLPPLRPDLPPLDVAAFVGFSERGPVDIPVVIEDIDTYRAIFGGDLPLARTVNGEVRYASLPTAVAGFFTNGGRRCYVVRVVGPHATQSRFGLPSMVALDSASTSTTTATRVTVDAASPGRWSAPLRLATQLRVLPLPPTSLSLDESDCLSWPNGTGTERIETGELLRIAFDNSGLTYLVVVSSVDEPIAGENVDEPPSVSQQFRIIHQRRAFATAAALYTALDETGPPPMPDAEIGTVETIIHHSGQGPTALPYSGRLLAGPERNGFILELAGDPPSDPPLRVHDLLQFTIAATTSPARQLTLLLSNDAISTRPADATSPFDTSPIDTTVRIHTATLLEWEATATFPATSPSVFPERVERLRFDLLIQAAQQQRTVIRDLGFDTAHPRFWGEMILLESSRLFQLPPNGVRAAQAAARYRAMQQPVRNLQLEEGPPDLVALAGQLAPIEPSSRHYLPLGMEVFFDEAQTAGSGEISLPVISGDDDLRTTYGTAIFVDAALVPNPSVQSRTAITLGQQAINRYSLQHLRLRGMHSLYPIDEVALIAVPDAIHVAWSPAPLMAPPPTEEPELPSLPDPTRFHTCVTETTVAGDENGAPGGTTTAQPSTIRSELANLPILAFHAETDRILNFATTYATLLEIQHALINLGQARRDWVAILSLPEHFGLRHCREWMRLLRERLGLPPRAAAYRGPANLADLSYAAVYHPWLYTADALDSVRGESSNGASGAVGGLVRMVPPDGAVSGVIAARSLERGVWVAPANVPLQRVLGLEPRLSVPEWAELFALGFNLIHAEPLDFRMMSAHTLSDEGEWLQLSVRRLLILLRKMAFARGMAYVFKNNDEQLRNAITLVFDRLLQRLFAAGALAGATPQQAYRIVHDNRINTAADRGNGRFFVDIQVAPAQPLEFITVRLLRTTDGDLQLSEVGPGG